MKPGDLTDQLEADLHAAIRAEDVDEGIDLFNRLYRIDRARAERIALGYRIDITSVRMAGW